MIDTGGGSRRLDWGRGIRRDPPDAPLHPFSPEKLHISLEMAVLVPEILKRDKN